MMYQQHNNTRVAPLRALRRYAKFGTLALFSAYAFLALCCSHSYLTSHRRLPSQDNNADNLDVCYVPWPDCYDPLFYLKATVEKTIPDPTCGEKVRCYYETLGYCQYCGGTGYEDEVWSQWATEGYDMKPQRRWTWAQMVLMDHHDPAREEGMCSDCGAFGKTSELAKEKQDGLCSLFWDTRHTRASECGGDCEYRYEGEKRLVCNKCEQNWAHPSRCTHCDGTGDGDKIVCAACGYLKKSDTCINDKCPTHSDSCDCLWGVTRGDDELRELMPSCEDCSECHNTGEVTEWVTVVTKTHPGRCSLFRSNHTRPLDCEELKDPAGMDTHPLVTIPTRSPEPCEWRDIIPTSCILRDLKDIPECSECKGKNTKSAGCWTCGGSGKFRVFSKISEELDHLKLGKEYNRTKERRTIDRIWDLVLKFEIKFGGEESSPRMEQTPPPLELSRVEEDLSERSSGTSRSSSGEKVTVPEVTIRCMYKKDNDKYEHLEPWKQEFYPDSTHNNMASFQSDLVKSFNTRSSEPLSGSPFRLIHKGKPIKDFINIEANDTIMIAPKQLKVDLEIVGTNKSCRIRCNDFHDLKQQVSQITSLETDDFTLTARRGEDNSVLNYETCEALLKDAQKSALKVTAGINVRAGYGSALESIYARSGYRRLAESRQRC